MKKPFNAKPHWKSKLPEGEHGSAKIEKETINDTQAFYLSLRYHHASPGTYTRLLINGKLMMSDTQSEYIDHIHFLQKAQGDVLINGLGLGCCLNVILQKEEVQSVTVIEQNEDVITLVGPHFPY